MSSSQASDKVAIILGATGATGKPLVGELIAQYGTVHAFVRKPFKETSVVYKDEAKLVEHLIDFDKLLNSEGKEELQKVGADAVYITLGTTRAAAGSASQWVKIDRDYVLAAAKAARNPDVSDQRVIYCSSAMASSKSRLLYPQSKGLTEEGLAALGYSDCIIFRPGFLANANREKVRVAESVFGFFTTHVGSRFSDSVEIKVQDLAKAMAISGVKGSAGLTSIGVGSPPSDTFSRDRDSKVTVIGNAEAKRLSQKLSSSGQTS